MTDYQHGFLSKCAEHELDADTALALLKMAAPGDREALLGSYGLAEEQKRKQQMAAAAAKRKADRERRLIEYGKSLEGRVLRLPSEQRAYEAWRKSQRPAQPAQQVASAQPQKPVVQPQPAQPAQPRPTPQLPTTEGVPLDYDAIDKMHADADRMVADNSAKSDAAMASADKLMAWGDRVTRLRNGETPQRQTAANPQQPQAPVQQKKKFWFNNLDQAKRLELLKKNNVSVADWNKMDPMARRRLASGWNVATPTAQPNPPVMANVAPSVSRPAPKPVTVAASRSAGGSAIGTSSGSSSPAATGRRYLFGNNWAEKHPNAVRNFQRKPGWDPQVRSDPVSFWSGW